MASEKINWKEIIKEQIKVFNQQAGEIKKDKKKESKK